MKSFKVNPRRILASDVAEGVVGPNRDNVESFLKDLGFTHEGLVKRKFNRSPWGYAYTAKIIGENPDPDIWGESYEYDSEISKRRQQNWDAVADIVGQEPDETWGFRHFARDIRRGLGDKFVDEYSGNGLSIEFDGIGHHIFHLQIRMY